MLAIARAGAEAGCREALFTLGDKPELRYRAARDELTALGHDTTISYLAAMAALVLERDGPVAAPQCRRDDGGGDRRAAPRLGLPGADAGDARPTRLGARGGPHFGSPDKEPAVRLAVIRAAGEAADSVHVRHPDRHRRDAARAHRGAVAAARPARRYGHIQEIIIQNFRAKAGTRMANHPEPALDEHLWTIAAARLVFGPEMNIQAPPNLSAGALRRLVAAGINDWGGVSPVTPDHVNPERPVAASRRARARDRQGRQGPGRAAGGLSGLCARTPTLARPCAANCRHARFGRRRLCPHGCLDCGSAATSRPSRHRPPWSTMKLDAILDRAIAGQTLNEDDIVTLFAAAATLSRRLRGGRRAARSACGDDVSYVVTRNINYTNICYFRCKFCAFSKGKLSENLRGRPYDLDLEEIRRRRARPGSAAPPKSACRAASIRTIPGSTYLAICRAIKEAAPTSTSTRSRRSKSGKARRRSACRCTRFWAS